MNTNPKEVYKEIISEALDLALREPILTQMLEYNFLKQDTLEKIISSILATRLTSPEISASSLQSLLVNIFSNLPEFNNRIISDINAVIQRDPACLNVLHIFLNLKGFHALQTYRATNALWQQGRIELAYWLANLASLYFGVDIHPAACLGKGILLDHGTGIVIGETAVIGDDVSILQNVTLGGTGKEHGNRHPKISNGVLIGAGAKILGNIEIGQNCKIAAGSMVLKSVPAYCTVAGVPAKIVRYHSDFCTPANEMNQLIENNLFVGTS